MTELPPEYLCRSTRCSTPSWAIAKPSWISPSRSIRSPHSASRISRAKPCSSTPARMRASTCSRLCFSSTTVSMPCRCRSCDSSRPDGPPPMMQTCTFMWCPVQSRRGQSQIQRREWMEGCVIVLYKSNMRTPPAKPAIQVYNLFGELGDLPDVVHCETIAARSVRHDWTFPPHRHARLHQVLLIERGGGRASLDGRDHPLGPMRAINVPVGSVHGFSFVRGTE